jgi:hypothetical protein
VEDVVKCIYYLTPDLSGTDAVAEDLRRVGVKDFYLHVVNRDEFGLKQHHLHSSNYLETLDILRDGFIGAAIGFAAGLLGIGLLMFFQPFGPTVRIPAFVYVVLASAATLFGAWEGGLMGVARENKKLAKFHDELVAGKFLTLVYVRKNLEATVRKMMAETHPEAALVAVDTHIVNPFSKLSRESEAPVSR